MSLIPNTALEPQCWTSSRHQSNEFGNGTGDDIFLEARVIKIDKFVTAFFKASIDLEPCNSRRQSAQIGNNHFRYWSLGARGLKAIKLVTDYWGISVDSEPCCSRCASKRFGKESFKEIGLWSSWLQISEFLNAFFKRVYRSGAQRL